MKPLLPGYDRPTTPVKLVDKELLHVAQQSAKRNKSWVIANGLLKLAYGY